MSAPAAEPPAAAAEHPAAAAAAAEPSASASRAAAVEEFYNPVADHVTGQVADLARLTNLNQHTLLLELQARYGRDVIYTYVSDILIAVNPFKTLSIYGPETMVKYEQQPRHVVPPHVYAIADAAYHNLFAMDKNQCIVISGESGAGKTESAKIAISYVIELCRNRQSSSSSTMPTHTADLEEQILQVSPLLEAFGNAQTVMNDNSSRFGKYTRLYLNKQGAAMGVEISEYLLEKSRVVEQHKGERNFHVFYYVFDEANIKARLQLSKPEDYDCLGGKLWDDNAGMMQDLEEALDTVGFADEDHTALFSVLGAILHLSNIQFDEAEEHSQLRAGPALALAANLLGVDAAELSSVLLGYDSVTRGEAIRRLYTKAQSYDCRDALAKALYGSLFGWIVQHINEKLSPQLSSLKKTGGRPGAAKREGPAYEIGVLDIFGFENFANNSFEQLCINVTHEQLQFFFNQHTFRLELEEYAAEGVDGASISFRDNKPLLDMFLDKPIGVFTLLDEECTFPKATDASFVQKLDQHFGTHASYVAAKMARGHPAFSVRHFAAEVEYNGTNMIDKNRDNLAAALVSLMQRSQLGLLCDVFSGEIQPTGQIRALRRTEDERRHRRGELVAEAASKAGANTVNRRAPSLSSQFKASLAKLVELMNACFPHFVRCIKPNYDQQAGNFAENFVLTQLGYTGVLEATRIRQEGYSWRPSFAEFVRRYKLLAFPVTKLDVVKESEASAVKILQKSKLTNWKVGKTKLFLKFYHLDQLEDQMAKFYKDVIRTQSAARARIARKVYARKLERKRMSAAQRAEDERREAEERARQKAERDAELAKQLETQRFAREAAELDAKRAEEDRKRQELEALRAQAEAEKAQADAMRLNKLAEAEEARKQAQVQREIAERLKEEREQARHEAEEARKAMGEQKAELEALSMATEEARRQVEQAAKEAKKHALERTASRKAREEEANHIRHEAQELAEQQKREAEELRLAHERALAEARAMAEQQRKDAMRQHAQEEARYKTELQRMKDAANEAKRKADVAAAKAKAIEEQAERERQAELARLDAERKKEEKDRFDADFRRKDFNIKERLQQLGVLETSPLVRVDSRTAQGMLNKLGQFRKNWRHRWFIVDLNASMLRYQTSEQSRAEKAVIPIAEVVRVFKPRTSTFTGHHGPDLSKHQNMFMIETLPRTYCLEAPTTEARNLWLAILGMLTNPLVRDRQQHLSPHSAAAAASGHGMD